MCTCTGIVKGAAPFALNCTEGGGRALPHAPGGSGLAMFIHVMHIVWIMEIATRQMNTNLEQQIDELEFLQSMYSAPGEFKIEDQVSYQQALAYVQQVTPEAPKTLSSSLHIPVNAHQDSEEEDEVAGELAAESTIVQYYIDISIRMSNRWILLLCMCRECIINVFMPRSSLPAPPTFP